MDHGCLLGLISFFLLDSVPINSTPGVGGLVEYFLERGLFIHWRCGLPAAAYIKCFWKQVKPLGRRAGLRCPCVPFDYFDRSVEMCREMQLF